MANYLQALAWMQSDSNHTADHGKYSYELRNGRLWRQEARNHAPWKLVPDSEIPADDKWELTEPF